MQFLWKIKRSMKKLQTVPDNWYIVHLFAIVLAFGAGQKHTPTEETNVYESVPQKCFL